MWCLCVGEGVWFVELLILAQDLNEMSVCIDDLCEFKICCVCLSGWGLAQLSSGQGTVDRGYSDG